MKKLIILMAIVAISTTSFAQFGIQAGATIATIKEKNDFPGSTSSSTSSKVGFTVGVIMDVPISNNFIFQPGLNFTQKGGKVTDKSGNETDEVKINLNYLEIPLNVIYKAAGGFFVGAGPGLGYAISGKFKETISGATPPSLNGTTETKAKFSSTDNSDDIKPFELSGNILAGYQLSNGCFIVVNYNLGFSNLSNYSDESIKNNYFGIRIGKKFGSAKK
ncbi:MAG: porin family protein [Ginsengibacter sp.]